jgi:hypothetical protein
VRRRDGDAALALFRRLVDVVVGREGRAAGLGQHLGDGRRQRGLAMVDVTDGADVAVRLVPLKLSFRHWVFLVFLIQNFGLGWLQASFALTSSATFAGTSS